MIINNPFQMNDWKFKHFIQFVLIIQVLVLFISGLNLNGFNIPIISQLIPFIYLTFIPGLLILRILRLHELGNIQTLLFSAGLSISSLMFIGFFMNMVYPVFGIFRPISLFYLIITVSAYVLLLCVLSYVIDKNFYNPNFLDTNIILSSKFSFLCIVPFLAVFGSYFVNYYGNNVISMILISLIGLILILITFDIIPEKLHSFTIWIIAISLVYMSSLISSYVWGWDIQNEYYLANLVLKNSYWNFMLFDAYNSMLSVVMLSPIYSIITGMNLDYVLKIIYPFLLSLVPLGLYKIFKMQIDNSKIAFLAVFLFMSFNTFYIEMLSLTREITGELFLISMLLLIFNRKFKANLIFLFVIFSTGLIVSHYSTNYFFIATIISVIIIVSLFNLFTKAINVNKDLIVKILTIPFIAIFMVVFTNLWYNIFSQSTPIRGLWDVYHSIMLGPLKKAGLTQVAFFNIISAILILIIISLLVYFIKYRHVRHGSKIYKLIFSIRSLIKKKISYRGVAALSIVVLVWMAFLTGPPKTWIVTVLRYLNYDVVVFTFTGFLLSILYFNKNKIQKEYLAFSIIAAGMLLAGILIPSFEVSFNISRIYEISFIFLAPFCVIGGIFIFKSILKTLNKFEDNEKPAQLFSIFLLIFLLFNAGFFSVLSGQSIPMHLSSENTASDYHPRFNYQESLGAQWLSEHKVNAKIFADVYGVFIFYRYINPPNKNAVSNGVSVVSNNDNSTSYMFLRKLNSNNTMLTGFTSRTDRNRVYKDMSSVITPKNEIYNNGNSKIYYG